MFLVAAVAGSWMGVMMNHTSSFVLVVSGIALSERVQFVAPFNDGQVFASTSVAATPEPTSAAIGQVQRISFDDRHDALHGSATNHGAGRQDTQ